MEIKIDPLEEAVTAILCKMTRLSGVKDDYFWWTDEDVEAFCHTEDSVLAQYHLTPEIAYSAYCHVKEKLWGVIVQHHEDSDRCAVSPSLMQRLKADPEESQ